MKVSYTPGSFYKRAQQTNMQKLNRQSVERYRLAAANAGALMFDATTSESQGKSELAAKQLLARVQADAEAAKATTRSLGALATTSI